jgi:hypothetical protein
VRRSDDEILSEIRRVADKIGESPSSTQFNEHANFSHTTVSDRFGSWNEGKREAGLDTSKRRLLEESKHTYIENIKSLESCVICSEDSDCCLDFHHIDGKTAGINEMRVASYDEYDLDDIKSEVGKCIILCANCHRKVHSNSENLELPKGLSPLSP